MNIKNENKPVGGDEGESLIPAGRGTPDGANRDQMALPRWKADDEFQSLVVAILRSLPLRRPSVLSAQSLRTLARATDGITAKSSACSTSSPWKRLDRGWSKLPTRMWRAGNPHLSEGPFSPDGAEFLVSIGTGARFQS